MTGEIGPFSHRHLERITQLINKTNQFNFTTRRYTSGETEEITDNPEKYISVYAKLIDKFGDNGITTVRIASLDGEVANMDLWVMSCRVFKRDLELAVFDYIVRQCQARGIKKITAAYFPTVKNVIVKDFYETLGFECIVDNENEKRYIFDVPRDYTDKNEVIKMTIV